MSLEADWLEMGSTTVTLENVTGADEFGAPTYGAPVTLDAIVQANRRVIHGKDGRDEIARTLLFILSTSARVGGQDRILFADSTEPGRILAVDHVGDEDGQHHVEVDFG